MWGGEKSVSLLEMIQAILRSRQPNTLTPLSFLNRPFHRLHSNFIVVKDESAVSAAVDQSSKKIFYFTASWCPPCRKIAPAYEKLSKVLNVYFLIF